jgi:hypothetical protein
VAGLDGAQVPQPLGRVVAARGSIGWIEMNADSGSPRATGSIRARSR